jgi:ferredoxin-nitrate reductase
MLVKKDRKGKISVEGDPLHPVNKGMLCSKGMNLHYTAMDSSDRLLHPLFRDHINSAFTRITWEEAIDKAAKKFKAIIDAHGPDAVGFYISGQCLTEEYYLVNKLVKGFIGTNNIDTNSRLCMSAAVSAYKLALGEDSVPGCYDDIELANTFFIAGANPAWCHPILFRRIEAHKAKNDQVKIIVVDPRRTQTAAAADLHLQIMPGTDIVLFHAIARGLIENGFIDEQFIRDHTTGFDALKEKVMQRTLHDAAAICGIRFTDIYKTVKYIGLSGGFISLWAMGLNQSVIGVNKNLALINLSLITGKIGKPGSGPFSLTGQTNAMGGREVGGMATLLSAHRDINNPAHRKEIADHWEIPALPTNPGLTATEMFAALSAGKMKAVWIICTNPLVSIPDSHMAEAALQKADFVIVQDISAKADTLSFAHLALPAATWLEKEGTVTNSERRINHLSKVIDPPGEALPDAEILVRFAAAMGWKDQFDYTDSAKIYREHTALTKGTRIDICQLDYERLKKTGSVQWPVNSGSPYGTPRLFTDHRFYHPDGKAKIHAVQDENLSEKLSEAYPLILTTGRIRDQWHTMTRSGKVNRLKQHIAHPALEIHPEDAAERDIHNGDPVIIVNERGQTQVIAEISGQIKRGVVFLPMHWGKMAGRSFARANNLTGWLIDPVSKQPDFKYSAVQVRRYHKKPGKIVIAGESRGIITFIKQLRALGVADSIVWIQDSTEDLFYNQDEMIGYLKESKPSVSHFDPQTQVKGMDTTVMTGHSIAALDREAKCVIDHKGNTFHYDHLILASVFRPARNHGRQGEGILHYKDKQRIASLMGGLRPRDALVLTGGEPGLCEAAFALAEKKIKVYVHIEGERFLKGMMDHTGASLLEGIMKEAGIEMIHGEKICSVEQLGPVQKLIFNSGNHLICKAVISFSREYPDFTIAKAAGLHINKAIVVNEFLQTNDPAIFALGEAAQYANEVFPEYSAVNKQAECLANYFRGNLSSHYTGALPYYEWNLPVGSGTDKENCKVSLIGITDPVNGGDYDEAFFLDRGKCVYKKCIIRNDRLIGVIFIGQHDDEAYYHSLIAQKNELGDLRDGLLRPGTAGRAASAQIICSCMQVDKTSILAAITGGCRTVAAIGVHLGAGTKCGSCKPELKELLRKG